MLAPSSSSLQRSLINERLYLMAAAATALSSASSLRPPVLIDSSSPCSSSTSSPPTEACGASTGLLAGIKQSISRQFANLARYTSLGTFIRSNSTPEASPLSSSSVANNGRTRLMVGDASNTLDANHLAAILHHYQYNPALPMNPASVAATAAAMGFILGPSSAQLAHQHLASLVDDPCLRPPPPSYTASMQDNRMRRILQERAGIQQALAQHSSSSAPTTRPQQQQQQQQQPTLQPHPAGSSWTLQSGRQQPGTSARADLKDTNTGTPSSVSVANDIYEPATPETRRQQTPTRASHTRSKSQVKILGYV